MAQPQNLKNEKMEENENQNKTKQKKIIKSSAVTEEAAMITELSRLKSRAHHYRCSSTCCFASVRIVLVRPVAALQTYLRMDCLPAAVNHPMPSATVATVVINNKTITDRGLFRRCIKFTFEQRTTPFDVCTC